MGCILFAMCALRVPFQCENIRAMVRAIESDGGCPPLPPQHQELFGPICGKMFSRDLTQRPCAKQLVEEIRQGCQADSWRLFCSPSRHTRNTNMDPLLSS